MFRFRPLRGRLWDVSHTPLRPGMCEGSKNGSVYATVGGVWWGVFNTPLQPGMCDPSKYRCNFPTGYVLSFEKPPRFRPPSGPLMGRIRYAPTSGYVRPFKKLSCFRPLRDRLRGVCDTPLRPGTCNPSKYRCNSPTGYVRPFKKLSCFRLLRGRLWGVCDTPLRLGTCDPSKYRCNSSTGYVRPFKKMSRFRPLRGRLWGVCNTPLRPGTCDSSKYRCDPPTGYVWPFKKLSCFRPLRGRLWGRMRYAPTIGYVRSFEIPMQFSNWVRVRVQKMDLYSPPSVTYGGAYAIRPYDWIRAALQKTVPFSSPSGPSVGCMRYTPTTGTCGPSKNYPVFVPFGAVCGAYCIRPYNRVRAALQKTIPFSSPSEPSVGRMQYAPTIGYVRSFEIPMRFPNRILAIL